MSLFKNCIEIPFDCWVKKPHNETRENVKGTIVKFSEHTGSYLVIYPTLSGKVQAWYSLDEITLEEPKCQDIKGSGK